MVEPEHREEGVHSVEGSLFDQLEGGLVNLAHRYVYVGRQLFSLPVLLFLLGHVDHSQSWQSDFPSPSYGTRVIAHHYRHPTMMSLGTCIIVVTAFVVTSVVVVVDADIAIASACSVWLAHRLLIM